LCSQRLGGTQRSAWDSSGAGPQCFLIGFEERGRLSIVLDRDSSLHARSRVFCDKHQKCRLEMQLCIEPRYAGAGVGLRPISCLDPFESRHAIRVVAEVKISIELYTLGNECAGIGDLRQRLDGWDAVVFPGNL